MNKYILLLLSLFLILIFACTNKKLTIIVEDNIFDDNEKIEFKVCNENSDDTLMYSGIDVGKRQDGKWVSSRQDIWCKCRTICDYFSIDSYTKLGKGQCKSYSIDKSDLECDEITVNGEYRFYILGTEENFETMEFSFSEPFVVN